MTYILNRNIYIFVYFLCFVGEWQHFLFMGELLVGGYFLHLLPFFLTDRTLFLHSYLPCVVYKILVLAAVVDHLYIISQR